MPSGCSLRPASRTGCAGGLTQAASCVLMLFSVALRLRAEQLFTSPSEQDRLRSWAVQGWLQPCIALHQAVLFWGRPCSGCMFVVYDVVLGCALCMI